MEEFQVKRTIKRLEISIQTPIAKTGNGAVAGGKVNNLMLIGTTKGKKGKEGKKYVVKGLRGWLNHAMMALAKEMGVEVCHTSEKTESQKGEPLLPEGFHAAGKCLENGEECIKHRLMGSFGKQSKLKFEPVVITSKACKGKEDEEVQQMHIATEVRNALAFHTKKAIQDFGERYFAGTFTLRIEFRTKLEAEELGFLLKSLLYAPEIGLGAAVNNGAGKMKILKVALQEVVRERTFDQKGRVVERELVRNLWKEMQEGLKAWPKKTSD